MASNRIEFEAVVSANQINKLLADLRAGAEGAAKAINDAFGGTVTKTIVFEERVDASGAKRLVAVEKERLSVADQLISRQRKLDEVQRGSVTSLRQQVNRATQLRDQVARYETIINSSGAAIRRQTADWTLLNQKVSEISRELAVAGASGFWQQLKVATRAQGLINISNGLVQITQGLQSASIVVGQVTTSINTLINTAADLQQFELGFKAIGAGAAGSVKALQESSRIALGLGVDLNTVQEGFRQLSPVVLNIGGTLSDVSGITEALSSRFAAFGITGDRARRVMNGIIQAFAKGKLQAEELTQQISESDPAFKTDLARGLLLARKELGALGKEIDGSVAGLERLVKSGKITSEVLLKVLPTLSKSSLLFGKLGSTGASAIESLEKGTGTINQVRANLQNLNQLSLRNLATSAQPLIIAFLRIQAVVTDFFSRISQSPAIATLANIAARLVDALARLADVFFVLVEGAVRVAEVFKPLLDLIANTPGVAELAGLAILGKIIAPFDLLKQRTERVRQSWTGFTNTISSGFSGPKREINAVTGALVDLQSKLSRPKAIAALVTPSTGVSTIKNDASQVIASIANVGKSSAREVETLIIQTKNRIAELRREASAAASVTASGTSGARGNAEQRRLQAQITRSERELRNLREQRRALQEATTGQGNKIDVPSLGGANNELQTYINKLKESRVQTLLAINPKYAQNIKEIENAYARLAQIEKERITSSAQLGFKIAPGEFKVQEVDALRESIARLNRENNATSATITKFVASQLDLNSAIKEATQEGATYVQRQNAIQAGLNATDLILQRNKKSVADYKRELADLARKEKEIAARRTAARGGLPRASEAVEAGLSAELANVANASENARKNIAQLRAENIAALRAQRQLGEILKNNALTANTFGNSARRLAGGIAGFAGTIAGPALGALRNLRAGLSGILGLIDPLTAIFIAAGVASRLYADGNRDAAEAAKSFKDELDAINAARKELLPGDEQAKQASILERAYLGLSVATVKLGNSFKSIATGFGTSIASFFESVKQNVPVVENGFARIASSIALVAGGVVAGAAIGAALGGPLAPVTATIGAAIGGISAAITAVALSSDEASNRLTQLKEKLKEVETGAVTATAAAVALSQGLLSKINVGSGLELKPEQISQLKQGLEVVKSARAKVFQELTALEGQASKNKAFINKIKAETTALQSQLDVVKQRKGALLAATAGRKTTPQESAELDVLFEAERRLTAEIEKRTKAQQDATNVNQASSGSINKLKGSLNQLNTEYENLVNANTAAAQSNIRFANTTSEINEAITTLQEENKGLQFTNPEDSARLDANLQKIKDLQRILEITSKTRYEVNVQIADVRSEIAQATAEIKLDPGPLREIVQLSSTITSQVGNAATQYVREVAAIREAVANQIISSEQAGQAITLAGLQYYNLVIQSNAKLVEAGRQFKDQLREASNQIINIRLSKPGFFSPEEIQQSAEEVWRNFKAALEKKRAQLGDPDFFPKLSGSSYLEVLQSAQDFTETNRQVDELKRKQDELNGALDVADRISKLVAGNFKDASARAGEIRDALLALDGKVIQIYVKQTPLPRPKFAGGPVTGGQQYQVNELGKEGFLSASGKLSPINAPAYGLWRAPGAGTVIPAHIMKNLDVPRTGVKVSKPVASSAGNGMQRIAKAIYAGMTSGGNSGAAISELASVQANQAIQIGKLSRVVNKLVEKDWNVNVQVRPGGSSNYMNVLNHRL